MFWPKFLWGLPPLLINPEGRCPIAPSQVTPLWSHVDLKNKMPAVQKKCTEMYDNISQILIRVTLFVIYWNSKWLILNIKQKVINITESTDQKRILRNSSISASLNLLSEEKRQGLNCGTGSGSKRNWTESARLDHHYLPLQSKLEMQAYYPITKQVVNRKTSSV